MNYTEFLSTMTPLEVYVYDKFGDDTLEKSADRLQEFADHGWEAYSIDYGEAAKVMQEHGDTVWELVGEIADEWGEQPLAYLVQRHRNTVIGSSGCFNECMVGLACERVAQYLSVSIQNHLS